MFLFKFLILFQEWGMLNLGLDEQILLNSFYTLNLILFFTKGIHVAKVVLAIARDLYGVEATSTSRGVPWIFVLSDSHQAVDLSRSWRDYIGSHYAALPVIICLVNPFFIYGFKTSLAGTYWPFREFESLFRLRFANSKDALLNSGNEFLWWLRVD